MKLIEYFDVLTQIVLRTAKRI